MAEGQLVQVTDDIYLHADAEAAMRRRIADKLSAGPGLTVAEIRDLLGTTRKYAVPLCEYLDRVGVTKREGDLRAIGLGEPADPEPAGIPRDGNLGPLDAVDLARQELAFLPEPDQAWLLGGTARELYPDLKAGLPE